MSSVVISGDTSGSVTLTVPSTAGSNTVTIPALTGTAVIQGQNSAITSGIAVASTSGTSIDFTSIPSWVKRVTVMLSEVSLSATADILIQLGGSGGVETTGYISDSTYSTSGVNTTNSTSGYIINTGNASYVVSGSYTFSLLNSSTNTWVGQGCFARSGANATITAGGTKSLSATLDRVRITTTSTDTFDAGSINILYE